ncbi:MAG: hypothetical protein ACRD3Q_08040 [Terriglobales bacterium]
MRFLQTEHGDLIAASAIVRIGALNSRLQFNRYWHEVDYANGNEPHSTTASADAVEEFLEEED